jgi:hypothetical protein
MITFRRLIPLTVVSALAFAAPVTMLPTAAQAQIGVSITVAPPVLPVYVQPPIPGDGYIWQPGYWAWGPGGYYWVPGTWVLPPSVGLLWTPGYWAWLGGNYIWHAGYWGPHIGYYGGINYGFGYTGTGYSGGHWQDGHFFYNRSVNNFGNVHVTNVYNQPVHAPASRVSFNGGAHGLRAQPNEAERAAGAEQHSGPSPVQMQHEQAAAGQHAQFSSVNHGRPPVAASAQPATFKGRGVVGVAPQHRPQPAAAHAAPAPHAAPQQKGGGGRPEEHHG